MRSMQAAENQLFKCFGAVCGWHDKDNERIGAQHAGCRVESMGPGLVYVSGRQRPVGEMNGKSGNLNNCFSQLYPEGCTIPTNELMCIFDADQVRCAASSCLSCQSTGGCRVLGFCQVPWQHVANL